MPTVRSDEACLDDRGEGWGIVIGEAVILLPPPSRFGMCSNTDGEGVSATMTVSPTAIAGSGVGPCPRAQGSTVVTGRPKRPRCFIPRNAPPQVPMYPPPAATNSRTVACGWAAGGCRLQQRVASSSSRRPVSHRAHRAQRVL